MVNNVRYVMRLKRSIKLPLLVVFCLIYFFSYVLIPNNVVSAISQSNYDSLTTPFYETDACATTGGGGGGGSSGPLEGADNIEKIFNFFVGKGLTDFQAAGILGNMYEESGFEPQRAQGIFNRLVPADNWSEAKGGGYGLVQWTPGSKMVDPVKTFGKDPNDLGVQLEFLWAQLQGEWPADWLASLNGQSAPALPNEKGAGDHLKGTEDVLGATNSFAWKYERCAVCQDIKGASPERIAKAQEILDTLRGGGSTGGPISESSSEVVTTSLDAGSKVYILGDSITVGAADKYRTAFGEGVDVHINASGGSAWTYGGSTKTDEGSMVKRSRAVVDDAAIIKEADVIVIAIGTNDGLRANPIDKVISTIRGEEVGATAPIFWVNTVEKNSNKIGLGEFNKALDDKAGPLQFKVISWAKAVNAAADPYVMPIDDTNKLLGDFVHPNGAGQDVLVKLVADTVKSGGAQTGNQSNELCCSKGTTSAVGTTIGNFTTTDYEYVDNSRSNRKVGTTVWIPEGEGPYPLVIFAPGRYQNSKADGYYKRYLRAIAEQGFAVAGANFPDNTSDTSVPNNVGDIKFLIQKLKEEESLRSKVNSAPGVALIGHSDGGFVVMGAGYANNYKDENVRAVIAENGASYGGFAHASGPPLLLFVGTNDTGNIAGVKGAYNSISTPYSGYATFTGADHSQYIVSEDSQYKQPVDELTTAFLKRMLGRNKSAETDLSAITTKYSDKVSFENKGDAEAEQAATAAQPSSGTGCNNNTSTSTDTGDLSSTIKAYAWPDFKGYGFVEAKPEYAAAIQKAQKEGRYVGGAGLPGIDCGAWVTTLMVDSGYEPRYNYDGKGGSTGQQTKWLNENWEKVGGDGIVESTAELKQGDVAMQPGHTFMFAGTIPEFNSTIASAALRRQSGRGRAPMAGKESINGRGVVWYRKPAQ